ncbi:MAG: hypothetical protein ACXVW4_07675, partial [Nocardioides sp.]
MSMGPQEARLRAWLAGTDEGRILTAQQEWEAGSNLLAQVAQELSRAAPSIQDQFKETGPAAAKAFHAAAKKVQDRATEMKKASAALGSAYGALVHSKSVQHHFDTHPISDPGPAPKPSPGPST